MEPGDAWCRMMSVRARTAPRVEPRPDRQRYPFCHPPRAHSVSVPSAAMVSPASTLQDFPVTWDLTPEDFAGVL